MKALMLYISIVFTLHFHYFCRTMLCKLGLCHHAVSVCLSVHLSCSWILSKQVIVSLKIFHRQVAEPFQFFQTKHHVNSPTGTPVTGASNAGGVGTNRDSG